MIQIQFHQLIINLRMQKDLECEETEFRPMTKGLTVTTFHETRRSRRQYCSLKKNHSQYSETLYSSISPSPDRLKKEKKSSVSPNRKSHYWQNWLLPEDLRKPINSTPPSLHSKSVCAMFADNNEIFLSENCHQPMQMASITKIMTAFTVINICNTYGIKIRQTWVEIQKQAAMMEGTSANLRRGEQLLVIDLLYGLMLPSGNDAAIALAQYFGKYLSYFFANENTHITGQQNQQGLSKFLAQKQFYKQQYREESLKLFVFEMNKNSHKIGLKKTNFSNPTGLTDVNNYSTAHELALLTSFCMRNHLLRSIFKKKNYICESRNDKMASIRQIQWKNTNKHLFIFRDCIGVKTGITPGAGPCLSSAYRVMGRQLIIIVLNSSSLDLRYTDAQNVYRFARLKLQQR